MEEEEGWVTVSDSTASFSLRGEPRKAFTPVTRSAAESSWYPSCPRVPQTTPLEFASEYARGCQRTCPAWCGSLRVLSSLPFKHQAGSNWCSTHVKMHTSTRTHVHTCVLTHTPTFSLRAEPEGQSHVEESTHLGQTHSSQGHSACGP